MESETDRDQQTEKRTMNYVMSLVSVCSSFHRHTRFNTHHEKGFTSHLFVHAIDPRPAEETGAREGGVLDIIEGEGIK